MTLSDFLDQSTKRLKQSDIPTARLDTLILIEHITGINRAKILADDKIKLSSKHKNVLNRLIDKRANHIPITQLTKKCEFYSREFYVDKNVMSPRPETEKMIDIFMDLYKSDSRLKSLTKLMIADIGTGSGCIGITIKKECPHVSIELIDDDIKALKVARINVVMHTMHINLLQNDLISGMDGRYQVLLCNLPYVPDKHFINKEARTEPSNAIFGGSDGLDVYRKLFAYIKGFKNKPLYILIEAFPESHSVLRAIANKIGYTQIIRDDFIQLFEYKEKN